MESRGLTHFYIASTDPYLNEYVPEELCHRCYFTHFSGSTGEVLANLSGKIKLFVDGRYHEQADQEVNHQQVEVVKVLAKGGLGLKESVLAAIPPGAAVGYEAMGTPLQFARQLEEKCSGLQALDGPLAELVPFVAPSLLPMVENLQGKVNIFSVEEKICRVYQDFEQGSIIYLSALDQIAWISNLRGYHLPYLSSFLGRAIVTNRGLHLFVSPDIPFEQVGEWIHIHRVEDFKLPDALAQFKDEFLGSDGHLPTLYYDERAISAQDYAILEQVFGGDGMVQREGGLISYMSIKDEKEIGLIRDSFTKSNQAIAGVLGWIRRSMVEGEEITERDIYDKTTEYYREQGAKTQSFGTISGVGPHSSIIHFSAPDEKLKVKGEDIILLDSGGYFAAGFATDTTRTILAHSNADPNPEFVKIFTCALKGMLQLQYAVVKEGTSGEELDRIARRPIQEQGYDYGHGTGHGVGIYVHEGGISISPRSAHHQIRPGQVVSIEPGIYIPGLGGVRHENIAFVRSHPQRPGYIYFEPLTWIPFDEKLLDRSLLSAQELDWFDRYQKQSLARGNTF